MRPHGRNSRLRTQPLVSPRGSSSESFMKHEFDQSLQTDPDRYALAREAAELLSAVSEGTAVPTTAHWQLPTAGVVADSDRVNRVNRINPMTRRDGPPLLEVVLRDELGCQLTERIWETDADSLSHRMVRIWGDMLAVRSDEFLRRRVASLRRPAVVGSGLDRGSREELTRD